MNGLIMALLGGATGVVKPQDVFSTDLYTGDGAARTITNGIGLTDRGGLVWVKTRSATSNHKLIDTARGATKALSCDNTSAEQTELSGLTAFNSDGFDLGGDASYNASAQTYVAWSFRQAVKFLDVVTYTGDGTASRNITHDLTVAPGLMVVKSRDSAASWMCYHRSLGATKSIRIDDNSVPSTLSNVWADTEPTNTQFTVGSHSGVNANGGTYVAYLFAHDISDLGIVQAGEYTGNGSVTGPIVTLGWQPQWLFIKNVTTNTRSWYLTDDARGFSNEVSERYVLIDDVNSEFTGGNLDLTSDGFQIKTDNFAFNTNGDTYIYQAIRKPI